jgi:hypothetical protein
MAKYENIKKSFRITITFIMHKNKSIIEICVFVLFEPLHLRISFGAQVCEV